MTSKQPDFNEEDWQAAEQALATAQGMPVGPERIAALKRAGQMRFDAFRRKHADQELMDRENELLRRGHPRPATNEKVPAMEDLPGPAKPR
jgi:hypothetical protein